MKKDLSGIHFDTLEQLCRVFNCEIGEIIVIKKDDEKEKDKNEQINKQTE